MLARCIALRMRIGFPRDLGTLFSVFARLMLSSLLQVSLLVHELGCLSCMRVVDRKWQPFCMRGLVNIYY